MIAAGERHAGIVFTSHARKWREHIARDTWREHIAWREHITRERPTRARVVRHENDQRSVPRSPQ